MILKTKPIISVIVALSALALVLAVVGCKNYPRLPPTCSTQRVKRSAP